MRFGHRQARSCGVDFLWRSDGIGPDFKLISSVIDFVSVLFTTGETECLLTDLVNQSSRKDCCL